MPNDERVKALLADLGKSTLRGVKKCPKCGTYNGTRGLSCKNKACDVVFKEAGEKRKQITEVCRLITGNNTQIFSVRIREKGPDYRGFVQLPFVQSNVIDTEAALITQTAALCFVETCQRTFTTKILRCHEKDIPVMSSCQHIHAALRCSTLAQPLTLNDSALNTINIVNQMKQTIWQMKLECCGPFVQRVSKNTMAVKCKVNTKYPVGYLHVSFFLSKTPKESQIHYACTCPVYKMKNKNEDNCKGDRRCIHYYTCIAAFASDPKLYEEFNLIVDMERLHKDPPLNIHMITNSNEIQKKTVDNEEEDDDEESGRKQLVAFLGNVVDSCKVEVEVIPEEASALLQQYTLCDDITQFQGLEVIQSLDTSSEQLVTDTSSHMVFVNQKSLNHLLSTEPQQPLNKITVNGGGHVKRKRDEASSALLTLQESTSPVIKKPSSNRQKANHHKSIAVAEGNENTVNQSFIQWLASVTERINQAMHYQFNGKPDPLVFHTPQAFFDCLRERISIVGARKRLPNDTIIEIRRDSIPLGTFTRYSWYINNIIHCKQIFETPLMPLQITRSFIVNQDGTYEPYDSNTIDETFSKTENAPRIKPLEHKTFLKVGNTTRDQTTPTPFIIEWVPDILPISHIGELRLRFEYGHMKPCV